MLGARSTKRIWPAYSTYANEELISAGKQAKYAHTCRYSHQVGVPVLLPSAPNKRLYDFADRCSHLVPISVYSPTSQV